MKKRLTSLLIVLCLVLALVPTAMAASAADFTDVKEGTWYYDYVNEVVSKGYFKGESSTIFSPDKQMTRAMFVTVLSRVDGATVNDSKSTFDDVPVDQWYTGAVTWANENKIVLGTGGKNFEPNRAISRIDMCLIMSRYISYYAAKTGQVPATTSSGKTFSDISGLDAEAKAALDRCVTYGLIEGTPEGTFKPYDTATRAEVAAVISRLAWTTTGGGGVIPIVSSITYYQHQSEKDETKVTKTGTGSLPVLSCEELGFVAPDGYKFAEWNVNLDGNGKAYQPKQTVTGVVTLYAQWERDTVDHINEAVRNAVYDVNEQSKTLYNNAILALKGMGDPKLNKIIDAADGVTSFSIELNDHQIDVALATDANDENVIKLAKFAYDYVMALFRGNGQSAQEDVSQLTATLKDQIKALLDAFEIDYTGNGWSQKIETAAKSMAEKGKEIAGNIKDQLKVYFKNVDASNLVKPIKDGTGITSVTEAVVKANDKVILTAEKDTALDRKTLEDALQELHKAVQDASSSYGNWADIQKLAEKIDGEITFEPAPIIAGNYGKDGPFSAVYTVKFTVSTGTEDYLEYKFDGQNDHFKFSPTHKMWIEYTNRLQDLKTRVVNRLKGGTPANPVPAAAPSVMNIAFFSAAPIAGVPVPTSAADGGQMTLVELVNMLDEMFKKVTDNPDDNHVDKAIGEWKSANQENFSDEDVVGVLLGEKELDMEAFDNSAIDGLIDDLVTEAVKKAEDDIKGHKAYDYERIEELLDTKGGAQELLGESANSFFAADGFTPKPGYEGIVDHLFNSMADKINEHLAENITDPVEQAKAAAVKQKTEDKTELNNFLDSSIQEQVSNVGQVYEFADKLGYADKIAKELNKIFPDTDPKEALAKLQKALELFNDLMDPDKLPEKTLGGLVNEMKTDVIKTLAADRWENYSARVERVFGRIDRLIDRLINTRYGDTIEGATIQIGENGGEMNVEDLKEILEANYDTYNDLVSALNKFVNTTAKISDLSLGTLGETLITVHASNYTYSFYVEVDLSKAE